MAPAGLVTGTMEIAIQLRGPYREVLGAARWAEAEGLVAIALPDHYLASTSDREAPAWDSLLHFAGLARDTKTIGLVDLVSPITFRHPAVYAKTAVTLADMSDGRFTLGLGTGWLESEHSSFGIEFFDQKERFQRLEESLGYLEALRRGRAFAGRFYQLEQFAASPPMTVPIVVGGSGLQRTPELAGRYADEFNLFPNTASDTQSRVERCRHAAVDAGRDPDSIRFSFTSIPVAGTTENGYRARLEEAAREHRREPERLEERLAHRGIPFGTPERLAPRLDELRQQGVSRLYLQTGTTEPAKLEALVAPFRV